MRCFGAFIDGKLAGFHRLPSKRGLTAFWLWCRISAGGAWATHLERHVIGCAAGAGAHPLLPGAAGQQSLPFPAESSWDWSCLHTGCILVFLNSPQVVHKWEKKDTNRGCGNRKPLGPKGLRGVSKILSTSYPQGENPLSPSYAQLPQVYPQPVVGNRWQNTIGYIGCKYIREYKARDIPVQKFAMNIRRWSWLFDG